ncbi:hypothetical protein LEP1GSC132_1521 [Leptospira kirschneri str. 200803703]|uniref:Uncharacterized protein n=1 Tax=Leptospira kirschneri serovar Bulgarica str. Nikolaevo TaxID=1240687 RepID=M6FM10_9LEPT|nr:hypothetical protein LEP1GSC176_2818 [Leptospira kirschneri str. MMD1493]EMK23831.1 hypothetical protein LEP1GSC008_3763 [Leptospira kirschneri serovar Bulgarica str. Nikolaevo]EMN04838.1 hypothetical protein LEP1GSC046_2599 [Leptospira kirschneri serovar Bim str. 1051]EMO69553.1 hypothetical protein LEP1GSC132_1521 [Leptospira kirschneri str. 200803703]EPG48478.1 hypothetical protein LEP1GSC049_3886 [Leptospira kirschneri serovar Cynopteri str. 3522 CT]
MFSTKNFYDVLKRRFEIQLNFRKYFRNLECSFFILEPFF